MPATTLGHGAVHADYSGGRFETLDLGQAGPRIANRPRARGQATSHLPLLREDDRAKRIGGDRH
jgi:hypothetical protein